MLADEGTSHNEAPLQICVIHSFRLHREACEIQGKENLPAYLEDHFSAAKQEGLAAFSLPPPSHLPHLSGESPLHPTSPSSSMDVGCGQGCCLTWGFKVDQVHCSADLAIQGMYSAWSTPTYSWQKMRRAYCVQTVHGEHFGPP